jgi:pimeloyl-ACP methyl ester carboxylesterase
MTMTTQTFGLGAKNVIYAPGGAFQKPSGNADARFCNDVAKDLCRVTMLNYSLDTPLPTPLNELLDLIEKTGPCVLVGVSAGSVLDSMARHPNIRGVVMVSGCPTFSWAWWVKGRDRKLVREFFAGERALDTEFKAALMKYLPEYHLPQAPTLIIHGDADPRFPIKYVRPFATKIGARLIENKGVDHGIENATAQLPAIREQIGAWLT